MSLRVGDCWGVASVRQHAGFPTDDGYAAPIGNCLVQWNLTSQESTLLQIHGDLITVMIQNKQNEILTVSFSGEVKIWQGDWKLLASFQSTTNNVIYGSWSNNGDLFSFCSKGPHQKLMIYSKKSVMEGYSKNQNITADWSFSAPQPDAPFSDSSKKSIACFNASLFKENGEVLAIYQTKDTCQLYLFSVTGDVQRCSTISPLGDSKNDMQCISTISNNKIVAVGVQRGIFGLYDIDSLELLNVFQATGSPRICLWDKDLFVTMSYVSGIISFWGPNGVLLKDISGEFYGIYLILKKLFQPSWKILEKQKFYSIK